MVLHKPSRFISELPAPIEESGNTSGLYENWVLELVAPAELPAGADVAALNAPKDGAGDGDADVTEVGDNDDGRFLLDS